MPTSVTHGDLVELQATLTSSGTAVALQNIAFVVNGQTLVAATDANGTARVQITADMAAGTVNFTASFAGSTLLSPDSASGSFEVTSSGTQPPTTTSLQFHVMDGGSNGITTANMTVSGPGGPYTQNTDGSGNATFNLPDGSYTYQVSAIGFQTGSGGFTLPGAVTLVHVTLTAETASGPTALTVTVEDEFGFPVDSVLAGDGVVIIGTYDDTSGSSTFTFQWKQSGGTFTVNFGSQNTVNGSVSQYWDTTGRIPGTYIITVRDAGVLVGTTTVTVSQLVMSGLSVPGVTTTSADLVVSLNSPIPQSETITLEYLNGSTWVHITTLSGDGSSLQFAHTWSGLSPGVRYDVRALLNNGDEEQYTIVDVPLSMDL